MTDSYGRTIDASLQTLFEGDSVQPVVLMKAEFDSGAVNLWSGIGTLSLMSESWLGAGQLVDVATIEESQEVKASGVSVTLNGVPNNTGDLLKLALEEPYQGRLATIWVTARNADQSVYSTPVVLFRGFMDTMSIMDSAESASIVLTVENRLIDLERPRVARYTSEHQKIKYPSDKGFEFVPDMQDKTLKWGG